MRGKGGGNHGWFMVGRFRRDGLVSVCILGECVLLLLLEY
jgi:hypothetical protein